MSVLVAIGECMVELWADESLSASDDVQPSYGGDVLNTLIAAARLGTRTRFITRVGEDDGTPWLVEAWRGEGIEVQARQVQGRPNGQHTIFVQPSGERHFSYRRAGSATSTLTPDDLDPHWHSDAYTLLVSGITQAISPSARHCALRGTASSRAGCDRGLRSQFSPALMVGGCARWCGGITAVRVDHAT